MAKDLTVILSSIRAKCGSRAVCRHCSAFGSKTTIVKHKHASEYPAPMIPHLPIILSSGSAVKTQST